MERKSPVDLKVEKIKNVLKDFARQNKEEKNWRNKQYQEKGRGIEEKVKIIRTKGENSQLPWKEVMNLKMANFKVLRRFRTKMAKNKDGFGKKKLEKKRIL